MHLLNMHMAGELGSENQEHGTAVSACVHVEVAVEPDIAHVVESTTTNLKFI